MSQKFEFLNLKKYIKQTDSMQVTLWMWYVNG